MTKDVTNKVRLGRTDLMVTPICFGTGAWRHAHTYGYDAGAERGNATMQAIFDGPVNFIDTSRIYGLGRSEERIGDAIRERGGLPAGFVVSTKLDRDSDTNVFDAAQARRSLEQSLKALGLERIDLLHLHDPEHARSLERSDRARRRLGRALPHQGGGLGESRGSGGRSLGSDDAAPARLGFRRAHHPQSLHARQPQRGRHARSRPVARRRGAQRRPLRQRRPGQGIERLSPLCLSGGVRRDARSDPSHRGDLRASRRAARRRGAAVFHARPANHVDDLRREQARARQETLDWARFPIPEAAWAELLAAPFSTDDPEATRDYKLG